MGNYRYGFRIVGSASNDRLLTDWRRAFDAHCRDDERAETGKESYLSAFAFGREFRQYLETTGSTKDYAGPCWSPWVWWDIDRENDIDAATADARRLAAYLDDHFGFGPLVFFSGNKGYHVGIPTSLFRPEPSATFHRITRRFAETIAETIGIEIDAGVYDKVRLFRSPNSMHPKTGLHKRRLTLDELLYIRPDAIVAMAVTPEPFEPPDKPPLNSAAVADWRQATEAAEQELRSKPKGLAGASRLNRSTLAFVCDGATTGDRHRLLFSAAANLGELNCPIGLAHGLLTESALDSGLSPSETRRQIDCGLSHGRDGIVTAQAVEQVTNGTKAVTSDPRPPDAMPPTTAELTALWSIGR